MIEETQQRLAAAIRNLDQRCAVRVTHIFRLENEEVGGEFDCATGVARRFVEVNDLAVARRLWVYLKVELAGDLLVWPGAAERLTAGDITARGDLKARDLGVSRCRKASERQRESDQSRGFHYFPPVWHQVTIKFNHSSTTILRPAGINVVELYSVMTAGPRSFSPASRSSRA